jgi:hypothetical protein
LLRFEAPSFLLVVMGRAIRLTDCQPVQFTWALAPPGAFQSRLGDVVDAFPSVLPVDPDANLLVGMIAFKRLNFEQGAFMRARLQNTHTVRSMMVALLLMSTPVAARDPEANTRKPIRKCTDGSSN